MTVIQFAPGLRPVLKHGNHDQQTHAGGRGPRKRVSPPAPKPRSAPLTDEQIPGTVRSAFDQLSDPKVFNDFAERCDTGGGCEDVASAVEEQFGLRAVQGTWTAPDGRKEYHAWNEGTDGSILDASQYVFPDGDGYGPHAYPESASQYDVDGFLEKAATVTKHGDHNQLMHGNRSRGGIDRADMPQIPRRFREKFLDELSAEGVSHTDVDVDPRSLRRTQRGLNPDNVRSMYDAMKQPDFDDKGQRIIVSRDNKVLDGHHRWAAAAQIAQERPGFTIGVTRIDMPMSELLGRAAKFNEDQGIESRSMEDVGPRSVGKHLQGQHDQQTHGKGGNGKSLRNQDEPMNPDTAWVHDTTWYHGTSRPDLVTLDARQGASRYPGMNSSYALMAYNFATNDPEVAAQYARDAAEQDRKAGIENVRPVVYEVKPTSDYFDPDPNSGPGGWGDGPEDMDMVREMVDGGGWVSVRFHDEMDIVGAVDADTGEILNVQKMLKHLSGQHDQQTHGKGGSSSTTPQRTKMGRIPWGTINNGEDFMTVLADDYKSAKGNPSADASDFKALVAERVATRLSDLTPEEIYEAGRVTFVRNPGEIDEQGAREHAVSGLVAKFAETANDSSPVSLAVQRAAEVEFGMKAADEWVGNESAQTEAAAHYAKHEKVLRRYVRAQYEETQSVLRDAGVEELEVYRGVMMPDIGPPSGGERTEAVLRPLSSWTTHSPVAVDFVTSYAMNSGRPTLLSARVPASRVFSLPSTGVGCLKEFEVVLLGSEPLEVTSQTYSGVNPFSKHLQGQHDQQSHGKGRSKEALSAITAASEKQAKVGRVLDDSVIPVDGRSRSLAMVGPLQHLEVDGKPQYLEKINAQGAAAIITEQGWDAPAQKVDKETFEALATQGDFVRVYRGGPRGLEEGMINGTPYIGDGIFGPGTYVSTDRSIAQMYVLGGVGEGSLVPMLMPRSMATPTARPAGGYDPLSEYAMQGSGAVLFPQGRDYLVWNTGALIVGPPETDQVVKQFGETGNYYKVVQGRAVPLRISNGAVIDPGLDVSKHLSGQHDQKTHGKGGAAGRTIENGDDFKTMLADDYISARGGRPQGDYAPAYKALVSERLAARMSDIPTYDLIKATNQGQIQSENVEEFWQRANDPANVIHYRNGNLFIGPKAHNPYLSGPSGGTLEAETILRTYAAQKLVNQWALSSNDADVVSLSVQKAAEAEFGITGSKRPSEYRDGNRTDNNLDAAVDIHYTKHEKTLRAFVRAQYDETQAMFARAGVTDLVVYRGRNEPESTAQNIPQGGTQVTARLRPMSSWSTDRGVAERFAGQTVDPGRNGVIMTAKVPVKQVISTPTTGNGCLDEYEVVILGPSIDANMTFFDQFAYEYYNE